MATYAQNSCTLSTVTDVQSIYIYHLLVPSTTVVTNNMAPKDATASNPGNPPGASSITITYLGDDYVWTISEPGINIQTNDIGTLYYIECTLFSDNTFDWGPIMTSSSYEAAKQAFNKATIVSNLVGDSPQHFWWLTNPEEVGLITHPAGAYVTYVSQESFKNSPNNQPNLLLQSEGISLRNGLITKAQMTSTGLEVLEGGIKGGQAGSDGFIYLSTIDYPLREFELTSDITIDEEKTYYIINNNKYIPVTQPTVEDIGSYYEIKSTAQGLNINEHIPSQGVTQANNDPAWRAIIGTKFGVTADGTLYTQGADIVGKLTATSGSIGGWNIGTDTNKSLYYNNQTPGATTTNLVLSPTSATNSNAIGGSGTGLTWFMSAGKVFGVTTAGALYSTSGKIGGFDIGATYLRNGNITSATNTSVAGVYLGTDGLNISNGTAASTTYITKTAINIGNKLTWNGTTLVIDGSATIGSGGSTITNSLAAKAEYSVSIITSNFNPTATNDTLVTLTAKVSRVNGTVGAVNYQWFGDNTVINGATSASYNVPYNTSYNTFTVEIS